MRLPWRRNGSTAQALEEERSASGPEDGAADPVSNVLKRTDVWFAYRIEALEDGARTLAADHARAGQPRHDLRRDGPLEMETMLEQQGIEVLRNWADRVRLKIHGAIETEVEALGSAVLDAREAVDEVETARAELADRSREIADHGAAAARGLGPEPADPIEIERILPAFLTLAFLLLLVAADFFANLPVFVELFPTNPAVQYALSQWEEAQLSAGFSWNYGVMHLIRTVLAHPEPAILALGVVVFLLLLGHKLGAFSRRLIALRRTRGSSLRSGWNQAVLPVVLSLVGVGLTVAFLFGARARVAPMAGERLVAAETRLAEISSEVREKEAAGQEVLASDFARLSAAEGEVGLRRARLDYARTISAVNEPILWLNLVLVIVAVMLGYLSERGRFPASADREAILARLRRERSELRERLADARAAAYRAIKGTQTIFTRIEALTSARILQDFEAKKARVACAIPLFRSENARLRGLDPADIVAFQSPPAMSLPSADELSLVIQAPPILERYRQEIATLQAKLESDDTATASERAPEGDIRHHPTQDLKAKVAAV